MNEPLLNACDVKRPYVFISYSHQNKEVVYAIISRLQSLGVCVWYDQGINYSENFDEILEERIAGCTVLIGCFSNAFVESTWCRNEIKYAGNNENDVVVLPAYLEQTNLKHGLGLRFSDSQSIYLYNYESSDAFTDSIFNWLRERFPEVIQDTSSDENTEGETTDSSSSLQESKEKSGVHKEEKREDGKKEFRIILPETTEETPERPDTDEYEERNDKTSRWEAFLEILYREDYVHASEEKTNTFFRTGNTYRDKTRDIIPLNFVRLEVVLSIIALCLFGLYSIYSASHLYAENKCYNPYYYVLRQAVAFAVGLIVLFAITRIRYQKIMTFSVFFYIISITFLILMNTGLGITTNGATRWIKVFGIMFRPGPYFILGFLLLEAYIVKRNYEKTSGNKLYFRIWIVGIISALIGLYLGNEFGIGMSILLMTYWIAACSTGKIKSHAILFISGIVLLYLAFYIMHLTNFETYSNRLNAFLYAEEYKYSYGYTYSAIRTVVLEGGIWGNGIGSAETLYKTLPCFESDYIFATIVYEWGLLPVLAFLGVFFLLLRSLLRMYLYNKSVFGSTFLIGLFVQICSSVLGNILISLGLLPAMGSYLPFISYGQTNLIFLLTEVGIALSISRTKRAPGRVSVKKV